MSAPFRTAFILTTLAFSALLPYAAHAQDKPQDKPPALFATPSRARERSPEVAHAHAANTGAVGDTTPEVFEDSKTGTVRFVINGKDILTIDADGIHVRGNIRYTGTVGPGGDAPAGPQPKPHDKPR